MVGDKWIGFIHLPSSHITTQTILQSDPMLRLEKLAFQPEMGVKGNIAPYIDDSDGKMMTLRHSSQDEENFIQIGFQIRKLSDLLRNERIDFKKVSVIGTGLFCHDFAVREMELYKNRFDLPQKFDWRSPPDGITMRLMDTCATSSSLPFLLSF
jgi:hypothetical protein